MSECTHGGCVAHHRDVYWNLQDHAWVHTDGCPCPALAEVPAPAPTITLRFMNGDRLEIPDAIPAEP